MNSRILYNWAWGSIERMGLISNFDLEGRGLLVLIGLLR